MLRAWTVAASGPVIQSMFGVLLAASATILERAQASTGSDFESEY
jgi:hypothetical protein